MKFVLARAGMEGEYQNGKQGTKVVIAAPTFGSALQISMNENFKKLFKPEEMAMRSVTDEAGTQKNA